MIITAIVPIDNKRKRVCTDEGYTLPLYNSEIHHFKLEEGFELSENYISKIESLLISRVKNRILYLLETSDQSVGEVRNRLLRAGYPDTVIESAIEWMIEYGYLDDVRFTHNYIRSMKDYKGKSKRDIFYGLLNKGISRNIASDIIEEYEFCDEDNIYRLLRKKGVSKENINELDSKLRNKLYRYLVSKGYDSSLVIDVLNSH